MDGLKKITIQIINGKNTYFFWGLCKLVVGGWAGRNLLWKNHTQKWTAPYLQWVNQTLWYFGI